MTNIVSIDHFSNIGPEVPEKACKMKASLGFFHRKSKENISAVNIFVRYNFTKLWSMIWVPFWKMEQCFLPFADSRNDSIVNVNRRTMRNLSIFPALCTYYLIFDTLYYLYTVGYDPSHPILYQHIILSYLPVFFRKQSDVMQTGGYFFTGILSVVGLFHSMEHASKVVFFPAENDVLQTLNRRAMRPSLSRKWIQFWSRTKLGLKYTLIAEEILLNAVFAGPHIVQTLYEAIVKRHSRFRYWFLDVVCVLYHHCCIVLLMPAILFIIICSYLNLKQQHYLKSMRFGSYRNFELSLKNMHEHTSEIDHFNRLYSVYISVIIYSFGFLSGSTFLGVLHSNGVHFVLLIPWTCAACFIGAIIPLITVAGSRTNLLNRKLFFKLRAQQFSICSFGKIHSRRRIVRLQLMNEYKYRLLKPCFRLVTSSPVNNEFFFFQLLGFLSVAYIKTFERTILQ